MESSKAKAFSLVAVGQSLIREDLSHYTHAAHARVLDIVRQGDMAFTNLEGTIAGSHGGWPVKNGYCHAVSPATLASLKAMGFDSLSLSNNHSFDLGPGGILSTLEECERQGFLYAGIGKDRQSAAQPGIRQFPFGRVGLLAMDAGPQPEANYARDAENGIGARPGCNRLDVRLRIKVSQADLDFLKDLSRRTGHEAQKQQSARTGYMSTEGSDFEFYGNLYRASDEPGEIREIVPADLERHLRAIRDAASKTDFLFVYVHHHHWENNWETTPGWLRDFAKQAIDAGACGFISHGIPLLQGIEIYKSRPIFYSLGNFIYHTHYPKDRSSDDRIWQSVVATCRFSENGQLRSMELSPIVLGGEEALLGKAADRRKAPHLARNDYGETEILSRLARLSSPLGTKIEIEKGLGRIAVA